MKKQELLYHYFSNSLTLKQEKEFNDLLKNDVVFKDQFEFENNLKQAIKQTKTEDLKTKLKNIENQITNQEPETVQFFESEITKSGTYNFNYKKLAFAASIALLVGWFGYNSFFWH